MPLHPDARAARRRALLLAATEPARTLLSAGGTAATALPLLRLAPRGEPHPVLVLPGLLASDASTRVLRSWLGRLGYPVVGWALGRNRGPSQEIDDELPRLVDRLAGEHRTAVSIVGWSLGGIFARRLARRAPRQVRQVVSLGSPFASTQPWVTGPRRAPRRSLAGPLAVPSTAVYSRWDGVVDWRGCRQEPGPISENVAVRSSHLGMGHDPAVLWVVADRLAQPRHDWRPFRRPDRFGLGALFPPED
ncbi:esterase/lipase family protein [Blastococcus tunisiensis]|uniref:Alpha/beta hydrolase family protein n=1 Tax=Blastococcus tunisiensis TaxID=1798228 RepID=A0A1I2KPF8_9ACTN|nr:alpha/beta hydrolase-fold protein [Blastococcus sp. DSM 46838]SFF67097.1 Alpha/beta hydrolase family protein [Blastococcus sp. DSM 46838]